MADFKYQDLLRISKGKEYDELHSPGSTPPRSGIYRCEGCGHEVVAEETRRLPPQNHAQHNPARHGETLWRLVITPSR